MNRAILILLISSSLISCAGQNLARPADTPEPCSEAWYQYVEAQAPTGDGRGHGPDLGSGEWKFVVEFKLGLRDQPEVPDRNSREWCQYIDQRLHAD